MRRTNTRLLVALGLTAVAVSALAPTGSGGSAAPNRGLAPLMTSRTSWDLKGTWRGTGGEAGTYKITQTGTTVRWYGYSNDGTSWAHDFTGKVQGNDIVGTFKDRPGFSVLQRGSLRVHIVDDCHLKFVSASTPWGTQAWTKTPCPPAASEPVRYVFRGTYSEPQKAALKWKSVEIGGTGSFKIRPKETATTVSGPAIVPKGRIVIELHRRAGGINTVELDVVKGSYYFRWKATSGSITSVDLVAKVVESTASCLPVGRKLGFFVLTDVTNVDIDSFAVDYFCGITRPGGIFFEVDYAVKIVGPTAKR